LIPPDPKIDKVKSGRVSLFELPLDIGVEKQDVLTHVASGNFLLSYLNPFAYSIAKTQHDFASNLERFDLVVCDGIGVQKAVEAVFKMTTPIISLDYYGIGGDYLRLGAQHNMSMCLVGAKRNVVASATAHITDDFPGFRKIDTFDGYGDSPAEAKQFILKTSPEMVLVGLGMGLQESYILELVDAGWKGVGICVGGFFDKLARPQLNYPAWTEKTRLRFLGRLIKDPRNMSKRYFIDYQPFLKLYLKYLVTRG